MTRVIFTITSAAAGGLVPLVLLFCSGCGDSGESRANFADVEVANERSTAKKGADQPDQAPGRGNEQSESPSQASARQQADTNNGETTVRTSSASRKSTREITFDTLKFDIEKGAPFKRTMLTPDIEKLEGQRVRIRGYMLPSFQQSGIRQFVLVRDNMECCFGPGAALYDCIIVEMVNDQSCDFSVRPIAVEGIFSIREFKGPDDMHLAIFHLDGERVR